MRFYAALGPFGSFPPESVKHTVVWAPQGHEETCFIGPIATRAGGVARGPSRGYRGSPGVARRLPEDPVLIRTVKRVVSEAQVRQNIVDSHIRQGAPKGAPEGPT